MGPWGSSAARSPRLSPRPTTTDREHHPIGPEALLGPPKEIAPAAGYEPPTLQRKVISYTKSVSTRPRPCARSRLLPQALAGGRPACRRRRRSALPFARGCPPPRRPCSPTAAPRSSRQTAPGRQAQELQHDEGRRDASARRPGSRRERERLETAAALLESLEPPPIRRRSSRLAGGGPAPSRGRRAFDPRKAEACRWVRDSRTAAGEPPGERSLWLFQRLVAWLFATSWSHFSRSSIIASERILPAAAASHSSIRRVTRRAFEAPATPFAPMKTIRHASSSALSNGGTIGALRPGAMSQGGDALRQSTDEPTHSRISPS